MAQSLVEQAVAAGLEPVESVRCLIVDVTERILDKRKKDRVEERLRRIYGHGV